MKKNKIEGVRPFNDLYFRSCYYHQLLAGLNAFNIDKDEKELLFDIILDDEKANYAIENNKNLKKGSIISLFVISESGIKNEYQFTISKVKSSGLVLTIIMSIITFIAGFILGFVLSKLKNKPENTQEVKTEVKENVVEEIKENTESAIEMQRQNELNRQIKNINTMETIKEIKNTNELIYNDLINNEDKKFE